MIHSKWMNRVSRYFSLWVAHDDGRVEPFRQNAAPPRRVTPPPPRTRTHRPGRDSRATCQSATLFRRPNTAVDMRRRPTSAAPGLPPDIARVSEGKWRRRARVLLTGRMPAGRGQCKRVGSDNLQNRRRGGRGYPYCYSIRRTAPGKKRPYAGPRDFPLARTQMSVLGDGRGGNTSMRREGKDTGPDPDPLSNMGPTSFRSQYPLSYTLPRATMPHSMRFDG